MSEIKYIKINDLNNQKDVNDMFEAICKDIYGVDPVQAKKGAFGFDGTDADIKRYKLSAEEFITFLTINKIACELKVSYVDNKDKKVVAVEAPKSDNDGLVKDPVKKEMGKQEKEIKNQEVTPEPPDFLF